MKNTLIAAAVATLVSTSAFASFWTFECSSADGTFHHWDGKAWNGDTNGTVIHDANVTLTNLEFVGDRVELDQVHKPMMFATTYATKIEATATMPNNEIRWSGWVICVESKGI